MTQAYLESGLAFRSLTLAELWDPARLIPRAVEAMGSLMLGDFTHKHGVEPRTRCMSTNDICIYVCRHSTYVHLETCI